MGWSIVLALGPGTPDGPEYGRYAAAVSYATAVSRDIAAPADQVWALVADLPRMGEWSPENTGGTWVKGATGPVLGAVFRGTNKNGFRRWTTDATVVACEPGRVFEFAVTTGPFAVANWRYEFESTDGGCRVVESWEDHRSRWFALLARVVGDHSAAHAEREMAATLANLDGAATAVDT